MAVVQDRIFLRPMPSAFVRVDRLTTADTSPALSGRYGRIRGTIPTTINIVVDGNSYPATVNVNGTWTVASGVIAPALTVGQTYDVAATANFPGGEVVTDQTTDELTIVAPMQAYEVGPNTDVEYGTFGGVAYGFTN